MAKLDKAAIVARLQAGIRQSVGYADSRLSKERQDVYRYYNGELPAPIHAGNSKYVSMDVWDAHESLKAQLLETFSGNLQPVTFTPMGADDVQTARDATEWCNYVVFHQNGGFGIMRDVIDDALLGRTGVAKVWWEERSDDVTYEMENSTVEALVAHVTQNPDVQIKSIELHPDDETQITRAELTVTKDLSQIRIQPMPPEEFFISPRCVSMTTAELCGHRYRRTFSELRKDGYDAKVLQELYDNDNVWLSTEPELIERHQQTDDVIGEKLLQWDNDASKTCVVYECYAEIDPDDTGKARLHQVIIAGDTILRMEPVVRRPFVAFVPLPRPHAFWGTNYDKLVVPLQNARTALTRSIIDHALITTNPRYGVVRNAVMNPRELMENRIGGIVNVTRPDGIFPLQQAPLNPFIFQTIGMLDDDKEHRTGVSRLSTGLNKDAVSKQNAADMVEQLVSLSQIRQKIVARNFAEGFLRDLYLMVYRLTIENEKQAHLIQIAGDWQEVDPTGWPERDDLTVTFTLGYGEQQKQVDKLVMVDKYLSSDQGLNHYYTPDRRYGVIKQALEGMGFRNVAQILGDPKDPSIPPPQPNPMQQAELAVKQADAAVKHANAQAAVEKLKLDQQVAAMNHQVELERLKLEMMKEANRVQLERDKLAHKVAVDTFEVQETARIAAQGDAKAYVTPNG